MTDPLRFTLPVTVGRIAMHVDRTVSITCRSEKEISDTEFAIIHQAFQKLGHFVFSETNVDEADIPTEDVDRDVKSQAPLLRGRCFRFVFSETNVDEADIPTEDVDRDVKGEHVMAEFKQYRRSQIAEIAEWKPGLDMTRVSISAADLDAGSPKPGDMIARNPKNHDDKWLIAADYFADNFEPVEDVA